MRPISGWSYHIILDNVGDPRTTVSAMELLIPYIRLIEDVPVTLWAVDELQLRTAIERIERNLNSGCPANDAEAWVLSEIKRQLKEPGLALKDYVIHLAMEPALIAFLKSRSKHEI